MTDMSTWLFAVLAVVLMASTACDRNPAITVTTAEDAVGYCAWTRGGVQLGLIWSALDPSASEYEAALAALSAPVDTTSEWADEVRLGIRPVDAWWSHATTKRLSEVIVRRCET